ncbi:MAG: catalase [Desulfovibrio sp.]|nr:catalase [Desulfovibrio sp.]
MLDALHSITARPVGPVTSGAPTGSRSGGFAAFPGLGEYGRAAQGEADAAGARNAKAQQPGKIGGIAGQQAGADAAGASGENGDSLRLSPEAQAQLRELKQRDAEVRAHEKAHMAAGGQYVAGGPSYEYQRGPDGRQYAIGGHVSIDASSIPDDPEASAAKARQVRRAALAPGEPSAQDRAVAAKAATQEARAAREKRDENSESAGGVENAQNAEGAHGASPAENLSRHEPADGIEGAPAPESAAGRENSPGRGGIAHALMRAAETYAAMAQRGVMPTALAPGGTGISLQI